MKKKKKAQKETDRLDILIKLKACPHGLIFGKSIRSKPERDAVCCTCEIFDACAKEELRLDCKS